ncbi:RNA polymerase sigma-70 domain protein, partial [mine drainage metagenome]
MKRDAQPMTQQADQVAAAKPCEDSLFENSVAGHIGWIYSMAYRQLADASLADDATQAVFLALWRKRGSLKKPIGGLLVRATRYACNDIQKSERRRKIRERKVAAMRQEEMQGFASAAAEEAKIEQLLAMDAALQRLSTGDRDVLVARFFQNQTARQVAEQFNISEAAAGKRITRAVEKLRHIMARKNIPMDS